MEEMIKISKKEYSELVKDSNWLRMLEAAGVDNWEGYDVAVDYYDEQYGEEE